jgi:cytidylate kinase
MSEEIKETIQVEENKDNGVECKITVERVKERMTQIPREYHIEIGDMEAFDIFINGNFEQIKERMTQIPREYHIEIGDMEAFDTFYKW